VRPAIQQQERGSTAADIISRRFGNLPGKPSYSWLYGSPSHISSSTFQNTLALAFAQKLYARRNPEKLQPQLQLQLRTYRSKAPS